MMSTHPALVLPAQSRGARAASSPVFALQGRVQSTPAICDYRSPCHIIPPTRPLSIRWIFDDHGLTTAPGYSSAWLLYRCQMRRSMTQWSIHTQTATPPVMIRPLPSNWYHAWGMFFYRACSRSKHNDGREAFVQNLNPSSWYARRLWKTGSLSAFLIYLWFSLLHNFGQLLCVCIAVLTRT